jgi:peptidoglycan hydrolase-like protein with peptidoglycan-binding domain
MLAAASMVLSLFVKSPAQFAADTDAPPPTTLTAPVESKVLEETVAVRGTVVATESVPVRAGVRGTEPGVITGIPSQVGDAVGDGQVVAQVSGRPIIVLSGALPTFRDILPGAEGPDVVQLQGALARLGYMSAEDADGVFGYVTQLAVATLYADRGFEPRTTADLNPGESAELRSARAQLVAAQRAVEQAETAATANPNDPNAQLALRYAYEDLSDAEDVAGQLDYQTGAYVPFDEITYVSSLPATVAAVDGSVGTMVSDLTGPLLTLQGGQLVVRAILPPGSEAQVAAGQSATVFDDVNRVDVEAEVASLGEYTGGEDSTNPGAAQSPDGFPLEVWPHDPLPAEWLGRDVRIVVATDRTAAPVLVVPVASLTSATDGSTYVRVEGDNGREERVAVTVGLIAGGEVAVEPVEERGLRVGDLVVIG